MKEAAPDDIGKKLMERDLGREAENHFAGLCAHAGMKANQSRDNDALGWDFYVEIPVENQSGIPRDEAPGPITCKVQVKATLGEALYKDLKLSALEPMVKASEAAFFCLFVYRNSHEPVAAYLHHADEDFCAVVLRRLRQNEASQSPKPLNKRVLRIDFSRSARLSPVTPDALKQAMLEAVGEDQSRYLERKQNWLRSVGGGSHTLQVTFAGDAEQVIEDVLDLFIGLKPDIDVSKIEATKTRFDIPLRDNDLSAEGSIKAGIVDLRPTFEGQLSFRSDPLAVPVKIQAAFYSPPAEIGLPLELIKVRAVTPDFEITMRGTTATFSLKWDPQRSRPLAELWRACWFISLVLEGATVHFGFVKDGEDCDLGRLDLGSITDASLEQIKNQAFADLFEAVNRAQAVCLSQGLDPEEIMVNVPAVMAFREQTMLLHGLVLKEPAAFKITVPWNDGGFEVENRRVAVVAGNKTRIGSACFAFSFAALAAAGPAESDEEGLTFYTQESRLGAVKFGSPEQIAPLDVTPLIHDLAEQLETEGFAVIINAGDEA